MGGEFEFAVEDSEVPVFGDDRDGLACVGSADAQALPGDHDDPVVGHSALCRQGRRWCRLWQRSGGPAGALQLEPVVDGDRVWPAGDQGVVGDGVREMAVQA